MVHTITKDNRGNYEQVLREMHRDRKRVFVDRLKWDIPVVDGVYEVDQFDTDDAVYLVAMDNESGVHLGSVRLLPSLKPHILGDVFPELTQNNPPRSQDIWEITRLVYSPDLAGMDALSMVRKRMNLALLEYGILHNITHYSCVIRMELMPALLESGWNIIPTGLPCTILGELCAGILLECSIQALLNARDRTGIVDTVLSGAGHIGIAA